MEVGNSSLWVFILDLQFVVSWFGILEFRIFSLGLEFWSWELEFGIGVCNLRAWKIEFGVLCFGYGVCVLGVWEISFGVLVMGF